MPWEEMNMQRLRYSYRSGKLTDYMRERCRLDVYHPKNKKISPQSSGFTAADSRQGNGPYPRHYRERNCGGGGQLPTAPKVKAPAYIEDAAAAVAWTFKNIETYGGSPKRIYVAAIPQEDISRAWWGWINAGWRRTRWMPMRWPGSFRTVAIPSLISLSRRAWDRWKTTDYRCTGAIVSCAQGGATAAVDHRRS